MYSFLSYSCSYGCWMILFVISYWEYIRPSSSSCWNRWCWFWAKSRWFELTCIYIGLWSSGSRRSSDEFLLPTISPWPCICIVALLKLFSCMKLLFRLCSFGTGSISLLPISGSWPACSSWPAGEFLTWFLMASGADSLMASWHYSWSTTWFSCSTRSISFRILLFRNEFLSSSLISGSSNRFWCWISFSSCSWFSAILWMLLENPYLGICWSFWIMKSSSSLIFSLFAIWACCWSRGGRYFPNFSKYLASYLFLLESFSAFGSSCLVLNDLSYLERFASGLLLWNRFDSFKSLLEFLDWATLYLLST